MATGRSSWSSNGSGSAKSPVKSASTGSSQQKGVGIGSSSPRPARRVADASSMKPKVESSSQKSKTQANLSSPKTKARAKSQPKQQSRPQSKMSELAGPRQQRQPDADVIQQPTPHDSGAVNAPSGDTLPASSFWTHASEPEKSMPPPPKRPVQGAPRGLSTTKAQGTATSLRSAPSKGDSQAPPASPLSSSSGLRKRRGSPPAQGPSSYSLKASAPQKASTQKSSTRAGLSKNQATAEDSKVEKKDPQQSTDMAKEQWSKTEPRQPTETEQVTTSKTEPEQSTDIETDRATETEPEQNAMIVQDQPKSPERPMRLELRIQPNKRQQQQQQQEKQQQQQQQLLQETTPQLHQQEETPPATASLQGDSGKPPSSESSSGVPETTVISNALDDTTEPGTVKEIAQDDQAKSLGSQRKPEMAAAFDASKALTTPGMTTTADRLSVVGCLPQEQNQNELDRSVIIAPAPLQVGPYSSSQRAGPVGLPMKMGQEVVTSVAQVDTPHFSFRKSAGCAAESTATALSSIVGPAQVVSNAAWAQTHSISCSSRSPSATVPARAAPPPASVAPVAQHNQVSTTPRQQLVSSQSPVVTLRYTSPQMYSPLGVHGSPWWLQQESGQPTSAASSHQPTVQASGQVPPGAASIPSPRLAESRSPASTMTGPPPAFAQCLQQSQPSTHGHVTPRQQVAQGQLNVCRTEMIERGDSSSPERRQQSYASPRVMPPSSGTSTPSRPPVLESPRLAQHRFQVAPPATAALGDPASSTSIPLACGTPQVPGRPLSFLPPGTPGSWTPSCASPAFPARQPGSSWAPPQVACQQPLTSTRKAPCRVNPPSEPYAQTVATSSVSEPPVLGAVPPSPSPSYAPTPRLASAAMSSQAQRLGSTSCEPPTSLALSQGYSSAPVPSRACLTPRTAPRTLVSPVGTATPVPQLFATPFAVATNTEASSMMRQATVSPHVSLLWSRPEPGSSLVFPFTKDQQLEGRAHPESAPLTSPLVQAQCGDVSPRYQTRGDRKPVRQQKLGRPARVFSKRCDSDGYWEEAPSGLQQFVYTV